MDPLEPTRKPMIKRHRDGMWWENYSHPMADGDFDDAFCNHVFRTTSDRSLREMRNRAYRFIKWFMARELQQELAKYREDYKCP